MTRTILAILVTTFLPAGVALLAHAADRRTPKPPSETGRLHLTFTERSPNSHPNVLRGREAFKNWAPAGAALPAGLEYDLADESFEVFVPPKYNPAVPHGLFVFISAGDASVMPTWLPVFARHKLIWVCANRSGNDRPMLIRASLALDAAHNLTRRYNIDPDRVYVSGFSGGGMTAAHVMHAFPDVFHGCFCINGENFYDGHWNEAGGLEPGVMELPGWSGDYGEIKKNVRLVLLTGRRDIVCEPEITMANAQGLLLDGFSRTTLLIIPDGTHRHPDATWFERGVNALDAKPTTVPTTLPTTQPNPGPGQIAQARRYLATAQNLIDDGHARFFHGRATACLETILKDYPTTPSAPLARELLDWLNRNIEPATPGPRPEAP